MVGTVKVLERMWSPQLENNRPLLVYLPPSYEGSSRRYPVLYMHDGQNLFDRATSFAGEWQVDETLEALAKEGIEAIVVGIPNMGRERMHEYSPFPDADHGGGRGDRYLAFLVETLKPRIDQDFRTLPDRANTGIMGSSMGGLISLYGFFRHPEVFGLAGVVSPSLWFAGQAIFPYVLKARHHPGRIYLDMGTYEGQRRPHPRWIPVVLGDTATAASRRMYYLLRLKGYQKQRSVLYVEEPGGMHNEAAWARRLPGALRFLLKPGSSPL